MRQGKEYEDFVFKIFSEFFKNFTLKQNERIIGKESGILREIDISIRGKIEDTDILIIVQCKDYQNHKCDLNVIGTFSAVIKDVGATQGFLVCSSGYAKSNSQYARKLGIELLSAEDIESHKWNIKVEIPIIYINYKIVYVISIAIPGNIMTELNQITGGRIITSENDKLNFSIDGGLTFLHINDHITNFLKEGKIDLNSSKKITFFSPLRLKKFPTYELSGSTLNINPQKSFYLKYIRPLEFRGIKDHLNKTFIPTTYKINNIPLQLNDTFIPIEENQIPINPLGYSIIISAVPN